MSLPHLSPAIVLLAAVGAASCAGLVENREASCEWLEVAAPSEVEAAGPRILEIGPVVTCVGRSVSTA